MYLPGSAWSRPGVAMWCVSGHYTPAKYPGTAHLFFSVCVCAMPCRLTGGYLSEQAFLAQGTSLVPEKELEEDEGVHLNQKKANERAPRITYTLRGRGRVIKAGE